MTNLHKYFVSPASVVVFFDCFGDCCRNRKKHGFKQYFRGNLGEAYADQHSGRKPADEREREEYETVGQLSDAA